MVSSSDAVRCAGEGTIPVVNRLNQVMVASTCSFSAVATITEVTPGAGQELG